MYERGGAIIQISSVPDRILYSLRLPYAVSKAALEALTRGLAAEFGRYQIRVNLVAPGPSAGARMNRVISKRARAIGRNESAVRESYKQASCLEKMVTTDDVVRSAIFLCSSAGANITGQRLEVSAGWMAERL
jgi:NAD(P)-dependent dehydrogenase (short-subunit alcohol dehydrogenase family)